MKFFLFTSFLFASFSVFAARPKLPFHLDLDTPSAVLQRRLNQQPFFMAPLIPDPQAAELEKILGIGKRNLDWLKFMNGHSQTPISFTKPGELTGIPITSPNRYSGALTIERYNTFVATLPAAMKEILVDGKPFTAQPPIALEDYIKFGREMDKIYQTGTRWKLLSPYLSYYARNRVSDIRGYYFLKAVPDLTQKLDQWASLPETDKAQYREWLTNECYNTKENDISCQQQLIRAEADNKVRAYHEAYVARSKAFFDENFVAQNPRSDMRWEKSAQTETAVFPFLTPETSVIRDFLAVNIEDEWKWTGWNLRLDFGPSARARAIFQPGITPHVNGLGGDEIYMDSNAPLSEWDVQWTIRHEFGHVLGFPDCYIEFYNQQEQVMINYQIDVTDLMCSRRGKFNERMYQEMKRVYDR